MTLQAKGERIQVSSLDKVPWNHVTRYRWAIRALRDLGAKTVIDGACGIGYGSQMAAQRGFDGVWCYDRDPAVIPYQKKFGHPNVHFECVDLLDAKVPEADGAISIETIEHIQDPVPWLKQLRDRCKFLAGTVPNQDVVRFDPNWHKWHFRHYTQAEFADLMKACGWTVIAWATQYEKWDRARATMRPIGTPDGQTLGVICQ